MKKYKSHSLSEYLNALSDKTSVPGGGSAGALSGAMGAALIAMVGEFSLGKGKSKSIERRIISIIKQANNLKKELLELVDKDAQAYRKYRSISKDKKRDKRLALNASRKIQKDVSRLCQKAVNLTPFLVKEGNKYLISDIEVALDLLLASYRSAVTLLKT